MPSLNFAFMIALLSLTTTTTFASVSKNRFQARDVTPNGTPAVSAGVTPGAKRQTDIDPSLDDDGDDLTYTAEDCEDVADNGFNASCWDTLGMHDFMDGWYPSVKAANKCNPGELWANCFMRETGVPGVGTIGCASVGPTICPEPEADTLLGVTAQTAYGAVAIWSLQNLTTAIYSDLQADNGTALIQQAFNNLTTPNIYGMDVLSSILLADPDPRTQQLGKVFRSNITVPGTDTNITYVSQASTVVLFVLQQYLASFMTNYTMNGQDWGFEMMSQNGTLIGSATG